jgi:hypothetical protein
VLSTPWQATSPPNLPAPRIIIAPASQTSRSSVIIKPASACHHSRQLLWPEWSCAYSIYDVPGGSLPGTFFISIQCIYDVPGWETGVCPQCLVMRPTNFCSRCSILSISEASVEVCFFQGQPFKNLRAGRWPSRQVTTFGSRSALGEARSSTH